MKLNKYKKNAIPLVTALVTSALIGCGSGGDSGSPTPVEVNQSPVFDTTPVITAQSNVAYQYVVSASDQDADDTLTLTATELPAWLTFDESTGELTGTPTSSDIGDHTVTISVSDGTNTTTQTFTISVMLSTSGSNWSLVWSDEFEGSSLNAENWNIETGDGSQYGLTGWGNNELQWYSDDNITVADGMLIITAKEEASNGYAYTSGRMRSDHKVDIKYGRIEAKIKAPLGQGLWSAFWMLPTDSQYGGWASGGEIDIMEVLNAGTSDSSDVTHGTIHFGMAWPLNSSAGEDTSVTVIEDFHLYAVEWEQDEIRWYIDDLHYATVTSENWWSYYYDSQERGYVSAPAGPFNQNFHMLLNLAVGGNWPGSPNGETDFDAEMVVDYVRVYECDSDEATGVGCANNINSSVEAPAPSQVFVAQYPLFTEEGISELTWSINDENINRALQAKVAWDNGGIEVNQQAGSGDKAMVLDINTADMGNVAISAVDGKTLSLFGMGNNPAWWELAAGELKFDIYIDSSVTPDDSVITIKMDSGWPALGSKEYAVADLAKDTWTTISVPVNDLVANAGDQALNTDAVVNLFVIEFSAAAHVQLADISLICGHKETDGCGIKPPAVEVTSEVVEIFTNTINTEVWTNGAGGWDSAVNMDYLDGDTNHHVNWQTVTSEDDGRETVLEVTFNADGADGVFYIQTAQTVDLSSFASGNLIFDIKVTDYASNTAGIDFKVDCVYPCSTGDQSLGVVGAGEWETITIPVANLVSQGLDLSSVNSGLVIFPTWGDQQGVTFQLDNIRWQIGEDGAGEVTPPEVGSGIIIYADDVDSNWSLWDCCGGATLTQVIDDDDHGSVIEVAFAGSPTVSGFEASAPHNASGLNNGTLEFDFKIVSAPTDDSANWLIKLESAGAATEVEFQLNQSIEGADPTLDTWQHFTFNLTDLSAQGLDLENLSLIMIFPDWGKANGAIYRIDNLVLTGE